MGKLTSYTAATRFDSGDILIKDGTNGTKQITVEDAAIELAGLVSAVQHRNVYRGKYLGTSVTSDQLAAIKAGTFDDLFIGDYWTINSVNWRIWDMDYWYNTGDTNFTSHHLVVVPDTVLYNAVMNSSNTTEGGYVGSEMYTTNLATARETITGIFGDNLLTHREYLTNAVTDGYPSAGAWYDSDVELMNEIMVYGCHIRAAIGNDGVTRPTSATVDKQQLALPRLYPRWVNIRVPYWLRDIVSSSYFAIVGNVGYAIGGNASTSLGVRPAFAIG